MYLDINFEKKNCTNIKERCIQVKHDTISDKYKFFFIIRAFLYIYLLGGFSKDLFLVHFTIKLQLCVGFDISHQTI